MGNTHKFQERMGNRDVNNDAVVLLKSLKDKEKIGILFVCLGNICRSPAADGILHQLASDAGILSRFEIDSAGTYSGHRGELPDKRMRVHAIRRGYDLTHRARPVRESDFDDFDIIVAMDDANYSSLRRLAPTPEGERKIVRMIDFCRSFGHCDHIPDPYYDGADGFENVLNMLEDGCDEIIRLLEQ